MTTFQRYWLIQVPGWLLAGAILYALHRWFGLPAWLAALLLAGDVAKDFLLYPFLRRAYETGGPSAMDRLVGATGIAREKLDPAGYAEIGGELWRATCAPADNPIAAGSRIKVIEARGMSVVVIRDRGTG